MRGDLAQGLEHVGVVLEREVGIETADDVELGRAGFDGLASLLADVLQIAGVLAVLTLLAVELAELAGERAHIRVVEVAVDVVVRHARVHAIAHELGQIEHAPDVGRVVEHRAVIEREALARDDLGADGLKARVEVARADRFGESTGGVDRGHE